MTFHSCNCHYLPSHVLGKIDKRGDDKVRVAARGSEQQAKFRRGRCNERALKISEFLTGLVDTVYDLAEIARGDFAELGRNSIDDAGTNLVLNVHFGQDYMNAFWDGDFAELGRNSIDDAGTNLVLNVHFGQDYMNAFWDGDEMTFGDGDGQIFTSFARSLDVMAQVLAHRDYLAPPEAGAGRG
jgi:hypothetical protein